MNFLNGKEVFRENRSDQTASIVIAGDCFPGDSALEDILKGHSDRILNEIMPVLKDADLRIVQFETALVDQAEPIDKSGPNIKCPIGCETLVLAAEFDVATLANNHIGDFGGNPALETKRILENAGMKTVGAGANLHEARQPLFLDINGLKIGIINVAEHEFGSAWIDQPGAAPFDPLRNIEDIKELASKVDVALIIIHVGNEYNPIPSPRMKQCYRAFADAGADAVINIHTHCPQGVELWNGVPIVYSPGNFFFPFESVEYDPENFWFCGYLPKISFDSQGAFQIEIEPYHFAPGPWKINPLTGEHKAEFMEYLTKISAIAVNNQEASRYYDAWCAMKGADYINLIKDRVQTWPIDTNNREQVKYLLPLRNVFTCETHCEFIQRYLRLIEEYRLEEAKEYIPRLKKLMVNKTGATIKN